MESETLCRIVSDKLLLAHDLKVRPGPLLEVRHAISYFPPHGARQAYREPVPGRGITAAEVVLVSQKEAWKMRTADECAPPHPTRRPRKSRDPAPA